MLDPEQFHSSDRWENRAIDELWPHLARALSTGTPSVVAPFPTPLSPAELVAAAVELCKRSAAAAGVLVGPAVGGLTFVPFAVTPRTAARRVPDLHSSRRRTSLSASSLADVTI